MNDIGCVSEAELHAFVVGELPERIAHLVTLHLEACANCEATARRFDSHVDPFLQSLRQAVHTSSFASSVEFSRPGSNLAANAESRSAAQDPTVALRDPIDSKQNLDSPLPKGVPGYEILEELGRGGMGVVYLARQQRLDRVVALKMLLNGTHASTERRARLRAEAEAIARLHHPGIVQVYDVGEHEGIPYLVLEYVSGGSLEKEIIGKVLPPRQAAHLIETLAQAVEHAHSQGIIHRDLKPGNILLQKGESRLERMEKAKQTEFSAFSTDYRLLTTDYFPKITDFGLAKQPCADLTSVGTVLGTPSYMAPEQAGGGAGSVGPGVDIYALGAILYELLTGRPPFVTASALETLEQIRTREPVAPTRLVGGLPRDLETVCLKCLAKEPGKRYQSALALAQDLRRYLEGRPVLARPTGVAGRTWRWARRNPGWTAMIGSLAALLLISTVGAVALSVWALRAESQTQVKLFDSRISEARALSLSRRPGQRFESLALLHEAAQLAKQLRLPPSRLNAVRNGALAALAMPDLYPERMIPGQFEDASFVDVDEGLTIYARTDGAGHCTVRRLSDDREILSLPGLVDARTENWPFLSRDGRYLANRQADGGLQVWQIDLEQPRKALAEHKVIWVDFHARLPQIAVAHEDGSIVLHDLQSGARTSLPPDELVQDVTIALHPSEPLIAVASYFARVVKIRDFRTGEVVKSLPMPGSTAFSVAWHPQGHTLAVSGGDAIRLFDRETFACRLTLPAAGGGGERLFFNHAGDRLATYGWNGGVQLYDVVSGQLLFRVANARPILALRFDREDRHLAGFRDGNRLGIWQIGQGREYRTLTRRWASPDALYLGASVSPDGKLLAISVENGVGLWDLDSGQELEFLPLRRARFAHFEPASQSSLLIGDDSGTFRWPIQRDKNDLGLVRIGPPVALALPAGSLPAQSASGGVLAAACRAAGASEPWAGAWILHAEKPDAPLHVAAGTDIWNLALSPNGRWLVTGQKLTGVIKLWDATTGEFQRVLADNGALPQFSPDGAWLAIGGPEGRLVHVRTWKDGIKLGNAARFSPDGKTLVAWSDTAALRLIDVATGEELARLEDPDFETAHEILFTPDGSRLITVNHNKGVRVWDLGLLREGLARFGLEWDQERPQPAAAREHTMRVQWTQGDYERIRESRLGANYDLAIQAAPALALRWYARGRYRLQAGRPQEALEDLRKALAIRPDEPMLANELAWLLCTGPAPMRDVKEAVRLARCATAGKPGEWNYHNTLGVALYRAGQMQQAVEELNKSLKGGAGRADGFDLYFLAMATHHQGDGVAAKSYFSRAAAWRRAQSNLSSEQIRELDVFAAEAKSTLGLPDKSERQER